MISTGLLQLLKSNADTDATIILKLVMCENIYFDFIYFITVLNYEIKL